MKDWSKSASSIEHHCYLNLRKKHNKITSNYHERQILIKSLIPQHNSRFKSSPIKKGHAILLGRQYDLKIIKPPALAWAKEETAFM